MPAEWEPHEATWIAWPHNRDDWPGRFAPIPWVYGEIVRKLSQVERVRILVDSSGAAEAGARGCCAMWGRAWRRWNSFHAAPIACGRAITGPHLRQESAAAKWLSPAGGSTPGPNTTTGARTSRCPALVAKRLQLPIWDAEMVLEGGSIDVNGAGLLLTTEECLLSPVQARNPDLSRDEIEQRLRDYLGVERVIWLRNGIAGDDTHGHVDDLGAVRESNHRSSGVGER